MDTGLAPSSWPASATVALALGLPRRSDSRVRRATSPSPTHTDACFHLPLALGRRLRARPKWTRILAAILSFDRACTLACELARLPKNLPGCRTEFFNTQLS